MPLPTRTTSLARALGLLVGGALLLTGGPAVSSGNGAATGPLPGVTAPTWPAHLCAPQQGHRITTTTTGGGDTFVAEPAPGKPTLTVKQAYANFVKLYGKQRPAERRATQIRYGLITAGPEGFASGNELQFEPPVRRIAGWMITNCAAPTRPDIYKDHPGRPGVLMYALADRRKPFSLGWSYDFRDHGESFGTLGSSVIVGPEHAMPPLGSTRYYSVPWTLAKRSANGRGLLLHYLQLRCYGLDHVNVNQGETPQDPTYISVILSTGKDGACAQPSAISPYMEALAYYDGRFGDLRHGEVGPMKFESVSVGGTSAGP